jgi:hypothetical protein
MARYPDGWTDKLIPVYPPYNFVVQGYNNKVIINYFSKFEKFELDSNGNDKGSNNDSLTVAKAQKIS